MPSPGSHRSFPLECSIRRPSRGRCMIPFSPAFNPTRVTGLGFERIRSCFLLIDEAFLPRRRHQELPGSSRRSSEAGGPISAVWVRFACARSRRSSSVAGLPRFLPRWERTLSLRTGALCCKLQVRSSSAPFHAGALVSTGVGGRHRCYAICNSGAWSNL